MDVQHGSHTSLDVPYGDLFMRKKSDFFERPHLCHMKDLWWDPKMERFEAKMSERTFEIQITAKIRDFSWKLNQVDGVQVGNNSSQESGETSQALSPLGLDNHPPFSSLRILLVLGFSSSSSLLLLFFLRYLWALSKLN